MTRSRPYSRYYFHKRMTLSFARLTPAEQDDLVQQATYNTFGGAGGKGALLMVACLTGTFMVFVGLPLILLGWLSLEWPPYIFLPLVIAQIFTANLCHAYGKARAMAPELARLVEERLRSDHTR